RARELRDRAVELAQYVIIAVIRQLDVRLDLTGIWLRAVAFPIDDKQRVLGHEQCRGIPLDRDAADQPIDAAGATDAGGLCGQAKSRDRVVIRLRNIQPRAVNRKRKSIGSAALIWTRWRRIQKRSQDNPFVRVDNRYAASAGRSDEQASAAPVQQQRRRVTA